MTEAYRKEYTTLGIAAAGVYATIGANTSVTIYDRRLTPYLGCLVEGGTVIDKRPCQDRDDFVSMVVSGPMLKESLPAGHKEGFTFPPKPEQYLPGEKLGGFDYVSLDVYCSLWEAMGAKIGTRQGDVIRWNNGEETPIPSEETRWSLDAT